MPSLKTDALVLRKFEYGETSQVLHLFTRARGRVHCLAKGSLRERSTFGGPLDLLERGEARLYPRKEGLAVLGGFERATAYSAIRRDRRRLEAAFGVLEILAHASREDQADEGLFDRGIAALEALSSCPPERVPLALLRFDLGVLDALGVGPVLDACVSCGGGWGGEAGPLLSPARGGALCGNCREADALALPATRGVLAALDLLGGRDAAAAGRLSLSAADLPLARRLATALLEHALEREVRGR